MFKWLFIECVTRNLVKNVKTWLLLVCFYSSFDLNRIWKEKNVYELNFLLSFVMMNVQKSDHFLSK